VIWGREDNYALSGREADLGSVSLLRGIASGSEDFASDTFSDLDEVVSYSVSFLSVGSRQPRMPRGGSRLITVR
jgi:hypothetical protein